MQPIATAGFQERHQAQPLQQGARQFCRFNHLFPGQRRVGVQVKNQPIRMFHLLCRRIPGMEFNDVHLGRSGDGLFAIQRDQWCMARIQVRQQQRIGHCIFTQVFLKKLLPGDVLGNPQQGHRAIHQMRQHVRRYLFVITQHVELGETTRHIHHPVRVGHHHAAVGCHASLLVHGRGLACTCRYFLGYRPDHLAGRFITPNPAKHRVPH